MGSKKVIDLKSILMSIIGFSIGFLFTNEIIGYFIRLIDYARNSALPTFVSYFGDIGGTMSFIAIGGVLLLFIALAKRWQILTVIEWVIIGAMAGMLLPIIYPYIQEQFSQKLGIELPTAFGMMLCQTKKKSKTIL